MKVSTAVRTGGLITVVWIAAICPGAEQPGAPNQNAPGKEVSGLAPRVSPADYLTHVQAGAVTIAAEFTGHNIPSLQGSLIAEDYIVVEVAVFGPAGSRLKLDADDFSLRINGKKSPYPSQPYGLVFRSLKDPDWVPPVPAGPKSKSGISTGGGGQESSGPPEPVKVPIELQRAMALRVQKAALPEGDRTLPRAGLLFFQYRGKTQNIRSLELIYAGPAGSATLALQP
jgi:hypothetical protein